MGTGRRILRNSNFKGRKEVKIVNSYNLAVRIFDCVSDGYDDEEHRENVVTELYNELSQIDSDNVIKNVLVALCERIEELELDR